MPQVVIWCGAMCCRSVCAHVCSRLYGKYDTQKTCKNSSIHFSYLVLSRFAICETMCYALSLASCRVARGSENLCSSAAKRYGNFFYKFLSNFVQNRPKSTFRVNRKLEYPSKYKNPRGPFCTLEKFHLPAP